MRLMIRFALVGFLVLSVGCAGSIESTVRSAREHGRAAADLAVTYDDRAPLLGGDRIEIAPDGQVRWWTDLPTPLSAGQAPEDVFDDGLTLPTTPTRAPDRTGVVDEEARVRLASLIASIAPWDPPRDAEDDGRLERRRAHLAVRIGSNTDSTWQWADPTETGDERITSIRRWAESAVRVTVPLLTNTPAQAPATAPNPVLQ